MECPNCHQSVETGAAFCGNCGQALAASPTPAQPTPAPQSQLQSPQPQSANGLPSYAVAQPTQRRSETKLLAAWLCGVIGIIGALFMPLAGIVLGVAGIVSITTIGAKKHWPEVAGLMFSCLALLAGLGLWAYAIQHDPRLNHQAGQPAASTSANLSTPCYSANFVDRLNVSQASGSCNMNAYNGQSLDVSTNAYKVYASQSANLTTGNFTSLAKTALEKDVASNLPGFAIDSERVSGFAGSPAYTINASDKSQNVAIVEAAVYHPVKLGDNIFIVVHAVMGDKSDLKLLEAGWQWK